MSRRKRKKKKSRKAVEAVKAGAAGMARATFGRKTDFTNRKKQAARDACRGRIEHAEE